MNKPRMWQRALMKLQVVNVIGNQATRKAKWMKSNKYSPPSLPRPGLAVVHGRRAFRAVTIFPPREFPDTARASCRKESHLHAPSQRPAQPRASASASSGLRRLVKALNSVDGFLPRSRIDTRHEHEHDELYLETQAKYMSRSLPPRFSSRLSRAQTTSRRSFRRCRRS